jgi:hypothetical protein
MSLKANIFVFVIVINLSVCLFFSKVSAFAVCTVGILCVSVTHNISKSVSINLCSFTQRNNFLEYNYKAS